MCTQSFSRSLIQVVLKDILFTTVLVCGITGDATIVVLLKVGLH